MSELVDAYRSWMLRQTACGILPTSQSDRLVTLDTGTVCARAEFVLSGDREMVVLHMSRSPKVEPTFFSRFFLGDLRRARNLYREMCLAAQAETTRGALRVLVCGDADTPELVDRLREASSTLSLSFAFEATSAQELLMHPQDCTAVLLAPSLLSLRRHMVRMSPDAAILCLPHFVYARHDAKAAIQLLLEALHEIESPSSATDPLPTLERPLPRDGRVLVLNVMYGDRCVRIGHRVYDGARPIARGVVIKAHISMDDVDDLLDTLQVTGVPKESLDAVGIVVPGVVNCYSMSLPGLGDRDPYLCEGIERRHGIPTWMDNNTNAAAMGCYMLQPEEDGNSLTLYRHQLGHKAGGQGTVIEGHLVTGRFSLAGEPKFYQRNFMYPHGYGEAVWNADGLAAVTRNVLLASIGTVSPDVAYIAVSALDDDHTVDALVRSLEQSLPKYCIPHLVSISDYRERMYLGEVALCLSRLP
jgi:hypothetical protein